MYRVGLFKKLLSFFWPVVIEKRDGSFTKQLEVIVYNGKMMLDTAEVNYSFGKLHEVMQKVLLRLKKKKYPFEQVLILGYGGGSAAKIIHEEILAEAQIVGVEIDAQVIELAKKYFYTNEVKLLQEDAFQYIKKAIDKGWKYNVIVIDIFKNAEIPEYSETFFEQIYSLLEDNGVAMLNTMCDETSFKKIGEKISQAGFQKDFWNEMKENRVWIFKPYAKFGATTKSLVP